MTRLLEREPEASTQHVPAAPVAALPACPQASLAHARTPFQRPVPASLPPHTCTVCAHKHICKGVTTVAWRPHPGRPSTCHDISRLLRWVPVEFTAEMAADQGQRTSRICSGSNSEDGWVASDAGAFGSRQWWEPGGGGVTYGVPTVCLWLPAHSCYLG